LKRKLKRRVFFFAALVGLFLLAAAVLANMNFAHQFSTWPYMLFRVELDQPVGYSFVNPAPIGKYSALMAVQYVGFAVVLSGLAWAGRRELGGLRRLVHRSTASQH
jgi:hypothetical protein